MFGLRINQAKAGFFDRPAVLGAMDKANRRALSRFGAFVRTRARTSIRSRKKSSRPGDPPSSHVGLLKRFIFFSYDAARGSVVIGPTRLSKPGDAPSALEHGGPSTIPALRQGRIVQLRANIRARPYMQPAFERELPGVSRLWKDQV